MMPSVKCIVMPLGRLMQIRLDLMMAQTATLAGAEAALPGEPQAGIE